MAYNRCQCEVGDIPHPTEATHKRQHSRCTRAVAMEVRRVRDTNGRKCEGSWYAYCEPCATAIRAYQGSDVEIRPIVRERPRLPEGTPRCLAESWCARPARHAGRCIDEFGLTIDGSAGRELN